MAVKLQAFYPDQCCADGYCVDELNMHGVDRDTATRAIEIAYQRDIAAEKRGAAESNSITLNYEGGMSVTLDEDEVKRVVNMAVTHSNQALFEIVKGF